MRILLVNVDSRFNLAIRRMYAYFKNGNDVDMLDLKFSGYPHQKTKHIDASGYDRVYVSNIFDINRDRVMVSGCDFVDYGGIGSNFPKKKLPIEIENTDPFYFDDEDTSIGFVTRGCIRKCWFCKVPTCEGALVFYNPVEKIVKHKKATFLDNNILAFDGCLDVFQWLIDHNIRCDFNQGLDYRLIDDVNMEMLSRLNYKGDYIFAFDNPKALNELESKLKIMKKYVPEPWKLKFYIYYHPKMDIGELIQRVEWCRSNLCKPYVMRDHACWDSENRDFLTDYAAYCNQPAFFKKMSFPQFLIKRHTNENRIKFSLSIYNNFRG